MQRLLTLAILGGLGYWAYNKFSAPTPSAQPATGPQLLISDGRAGIMYDRAIGPGLNGSTNVAKIHVMDTMDYPMGSLAKH